MQGKEPRPSDVCPWPSFWWVEGGNGFSSKSTTGPHNAWLQGLGSLWCKSQEREISPWSIGGLPSFTILGNDGNLHEGDSRLRTYLEQTINSNYQIDHYLKRHMWVHVSGWIKREGRTWTSCTHAALAQFCLHNGIMTRRQTCIYIYDILV